MKETEIDIVNKWARIGILKNLTAELLHVTGLALEAQRLRNEQENDTAIYAPFKRVSIPIVRRVLPELDHERFKITGGLTGGRHVAATGTKWDYEADCQKLEPKSANVLDNEAEMTIKWSADLIPKMNALIAEKAGGDTFVFCGFSLKDGEIHVNYDLSAHSFTHDDVDRLVNNAGTMSACSYECFLNDTIKEKYEGVYVKMVEMTNVVTAKTGQNEGFWVVMSPSIYRFFEAATTACFAGRQVAPEGEGVHYRENINNRWRAYTDPLLKDGQILIGVGGKNEAHSHYGVVNILDLPTST